MFLTEIAASNYLKKPETPKERAKLPSLDLINVNVNISVNV